MKKKKLEQLSPHLFLVGIVAIVAVVALVLHGSGTTGGATRVPQGTCEDTDPKNDWYTYGTVTLKDARGEINIVKADRCNGDAVQQFVCGSQGSYRQIDRICPKKPCGDGEVCETVKLCEDGVCLYAAEQG